MSDPQSARKPRTSPGAQQARLPGSSPDPFSGPASDRAFDQVSDAQQLPPVAARDAAWSASRDASPAAGRPQTDGFTPVPAPGAGRGMPALAQTRRRARGWWLTPLAVVAVCGAGAVWTVHGFVSRHEAAEKARRDTAQDGPPDGRTFDDPPAPVAASMPARLPALRAMLAGPASAPATPGTPAALAVPLHLSASGPATRSYYDAPLLATGETGTERGAGLADTVARSGLPGGTGLPDAPDVPGGSAAVTTAATPGQMPGPGSLAQALTPTATPRMQAGFTGNRSLLLAQGTKISCVGDTAFDSTLAGISTCTVTSNVYSDDGRVVLVERGSQINSEYRSNPAAGQKRVFILAARIRTPSGVSVEIDSPSADALGRMGTSGHVDNHWGERIGAALLLGLTQDAIAYLDTRGDNSSSTSVYENTQQQGNDMASRVLDHTINIAPTLTQDQGAEFTIVIARDLDFSGVYRLEAEGAQ